MPWRGSGGASGGVIDELDELDELVEFVELRGAGVCSDSARWPRQPKRNAK